MAHTLPSVAATHANVSGISGLDNVMQSLHRLLDWCVGIKPVALQDVDIIELQTLEGLLYGVEYMLRQGITNRLYRMRCECLPCD